MSEQYSKLSIERKNNILISMWQRAFNLVIYSPKLCFQEASVKLMFSSPNRVLFKLKLFYIMFNNNNNNDSNNNNNNNNNNTQYNIYIVLILKLEVLYK